ncbi:DUF86 domain-containing protein [Cohnella cholangitidis]|uniref:DUF86 domain-containing protein n=1 Tax=Cohnella cholangitidis TaxID=2598458 RepID=A0A7G5BUI3_9BACL|nr:HepT-like ribonuclease domain-containing protein [Cohnella cholangitidis]QMV40617.1 DUF86 domain-containing protein [Cohnella cholangitidis]
MYDVNVGSIRSRLACLPELAQALSASTVSWQGGLIEGLAQERALHLAAEIVTDVGHALIDGFIMRDASSYEDIIEIIAGEGVITTEIAEPLRRLVLLRKTLVQEYERWQRSELHPLTAELPRVLMGFSDQVEAYLQKELI